MMGSEPQFGLRFVVLENDVGPDYGSDPMAASARTHSATSAGPR